ncbi:TetR family transcriptional regulator [Luteimonas aquatica]|uniref:TetR family transcriptional regulator n=1 Tax=Luteimonas aquatica TaxID=450364 RepID=UPI001F55C62C|nr:TetR family transcriptional regulator [Luteimonas aquatica]
MQQVARNSPVKRSEEGDARHQLVLAALDCFASHGIEGVSLRTITTAAGQANQSAVHYHFGNRHGLVAAVLDAVNEMMAPAQAAALAELANARGALSVRGIVAIAFAPYVNLFADSALGRKAIRFLARLTWQAGSGGQNLLVRKVGPYFQQVAVSLRAALPDKPQEALALHIYMSLCNLIHGLADTSLLNVEPYSGVDRLYRYDVDAVREYFYDYIAAGLASEVAGQGRPPGAGTAAA